MKFQNPSLNFFLNRRTNVRTDKWTDKPKAICSPLFQSGGHKNGVAAFSWLFFIRSYSYLPVMMTWTRALRISKFSQIRLLTAELAALERLKKIPIDV